MRFSGAIWHQTQGTKHVLVASMIPHQRQFHMNASETEHVYQFTVSNKPVWNKTRTSKVGAISKAQKAQKNFFGKTCKFWKKFFFQKKSHSAEKCKREDPLGCINIHSVANHEKTWRGDPFGTLNFFSKKSRSVPKKSPKGGSFRHVRFCRLPWKSEKMKGDPLD